MSEPGRSGTRDIVDLRGAVLRAQRILERIGAWAQGRSYWALIALASVVVLVKTGFKWAGTTGEGWFVEFHDVIEAWPLKESLTVADREFYQENYSSIVMFKALHAVGFPDSSMTWMLIHWAASILAVVLLVIWARRTYPDGSARIVALLLLFGAATMVLLHEIGRYDSLYYLGAVIIVVSRRWWWVVLGILILGTSSWTMGLGLAAGLFLAGLVIRSRGLVVRGLGTLAGCAAAVVILMVARAIAGGDVAVGRLGAFTPGGTTNDINPVYLAWWNIVQPFPNWIWAALGVTWLLLALVVLQAARHRWLLALAILTLPILAGLINSGDGTREYALTLTAILVGVGAVLQGRSTRDTAGGSPPGASLVMLGLVVVLCVAAPVINVNPHQPLNPWGWLGLYGLSVVERIVG